MSDPHPGPAPGRKRPQGSAATAERARWVPGRRENLAPERVRANFRIDLLSSIFGVAMFGFVVPFMPIVVRRMGGSEFEVALVIASAFIGHLLSPFCAYLLSPVPFARAVALSSALGRLVFLGGALAATTPLLLALSYVGFWIGTLANIAHYTALMQGMYPDEQRATAMGRVRIGASLAGLGAAGAGGVVLQLSDEPTHVLAVAAAISLVGSLVFTLIRHDEAHDQPRVASPLRLAPMALTDRPFRRFLVASTVLGFGNLIGLTIYPLLLVDRFDAPNAFVGLYAATSAAATMAGYHFWGRRIDRGSSIGLTLANSALLLGLPLVYLLAPATPFLLPGALIAGLTLAGGDLTFHTNMVQLAPKGRAADYQAAQSFAAGVRGTVAPFVASALLVATNATVVLLATLGLALVGLALLRDVALRIERSERPGLVAPASGD